MSEQVLQSRRSSTQSNAEHPSPADQASPEEKRQVTEELSQTIGETHEILVSAKTVFPLTLFPDSITVDRAKITISKRNFLKSGEVLSIAMEDILNITATVGPFFGKIVIATKFFNPDKPYVIDHFWRDDALKVKRVVQGYLVAQKKDIDVSVLPSEELADKLDELGKERKAERV